MCLKKTPILTLEVYISPRMVYSETVFTRYVRVEFMTAVFYYGDFESLSIQAGMAVLVFLSTLDGWGGELEQSSTRIAFTERPQARCNGNPGSLGSIGAALTRTFGTSRRFPGGCF